jgi:hypothetical protein
MGKQEEEYWKKAGQKDAVSLAQKNRAASERYMHSGHDLHPENRPAH